MTGGLRQQWFTGKAAFALPFFLSFVLTPVPAFAGEEQLAPFTPWHVEWTDKTCVMRRGFGDEKHFVVLQIERFAPTDSFQLVVTGDCLKYLRQGWRFLVSYGDRAPGKVRYYQIGKTDKGVASVFLSSSSLAPEDEHGEPSLPVTPEMEAATKTVNLEWSDKRLVLKTGPLDKAFSALRACTDDLVKTWGLDPAVQQSLSRQVTPKNDPAFWARPEDYPLDALRRGEQAIVSFRLSVDVTGKPTACDVQRSYSGKLFDTYTCDLLMKRALRTRAR
jgi:hypothetical protein